jgi:GntR family transcriptional regulator, transcriptional repressor for pyruvate dehydrogenase complex
MAADGWVTPKLQARSLRHDIAEALREAIREHHLAPGARILGTERPSLPRASASAASPSAKRDAVADGDVNRLVKLDLELHESIVTRANHRLLREVLDSIAVYSRGFIVHTKSYYDADLAQVADSHERLVAEILSGDPRRAEVAVQEHIREAAARLQWVYAKREHAS